MLSLTVRTTKSVNEIEERLVSFFGMGGLGLEDASQGHSLRFSGGGGHVIAEVNRQGTETVIEFETREFENQVKEFAREIG